MEDAKQEGAKDGRRWASEALNAAQRDEAERMASEYLEFQREAKTTWETGRETVRRLEEAGFVPIEELEAEVNAGARYEDLVGRKVYMASDGYRNVAAIVLGEQGLEAGLSIAFAHMDKPELHVKRSPGALFDTGDGVFLDTQYYGGIKPHQWSARPLELRGEVAKGGKLHHFAIDLATVPEKLPHLDREQRSKKVEDAFPAEKLDVFTGYFKETDFLAAASEKAGVALTKDDLLNASLAVVPRGDAYRVGEVIVGQHDDTICVYSQTAAIAAIGTPKRTAVAICFDKEETGSDGRTGAQGAFFDHVVDRLAGVVKRAEVAAKLKGKDYAAVWAEERYLQDSGAFKRDVLYASKALSADVNAAYNPISPENFDPRCSARMGRGVVVTPYTGSGGKYGTSEAPIDATEELGALDVRDGVPYQSGLLGAVDKGGGGTIAKYVAQRGVGTTDTGPALWSMHSPASEVAHVADLYACEKELEAFLAG